MSESVFQASLQALQCNDTREKCLQTSQVFERFKAGELSLEDHRAATPIQTPGRPEKPELVSGQEVKRRKLTTPEGRAILIHALTHIEFNAINLALDAVYRFRGLPSDYYLQWLSVAVEEAKHFKMLEVRLNEYGFEYGDFPAHNGLWDMAVRTDQSLLERMALVPRVMEARGLDVTPGMIERLLQACDNETAEILKVIYQDEIGHVEIGNRWFHFACEQASIDPQLKFIELINMHFEGQLRGKLNYEARLQAGFTLQELDQMQELSKP